MMVIPTTEYAMKTSLTLRFMVAMVPRFGVGEKGATDPRQLSAMVLARARVAAKSPPTRPALGFREE
jgi:hypothetical protein